MSMKLFLGLARDYACLNKARMKTQFVALCVGLLLLEYAVFEPISRQLSTELLLWSVSAAVITVLVTAAVVALFNFLTAYATVWQLARDQRLSVPEYLTSTHYKQVGKSHLKQGPLKVW